MYLLLFQSSEFMWWCYLGIFFILCFFFFFGSRGTLVLQLEKADRLLKRKLQFICLTVCYIWIILKVKKIRPFPQPPTHAHPPKGKKIPDGTGKIFQNSSVYF